MSTGAAAERSAFMASGGSWTRRHFLGTVSALSLGAVAGCDLGGDVGEDFGGGGGSGKLGAPPGAGGGDGVLTPKPPLSLQVHCELSEDYFLFTNHKFAPTKDTVIAYSRADGEVEGVLLQDGAVKVLYRDSGVPGGWNVYQLPDASSGVVDMVAGISNPFNDNGQAVGPQTLKIFYRKQGSTALNIAVENAGSSPTFTTTTVDWDDQAGPLQISVNADNSLMVAAIRPSSSDNSADGRLYYYLDAPTAGVGPGAGSPGWGYLTGFNSRAASKDGLEFGLISGWSAVVAQPDAWLGGQAWIMLQLPFAMHLNTDYPSVRQWVAAAGPGASQKANAQDPPRVLSSTPPALPDSAQAIPVSVTALTVLGSRNEPTALVQAMADDGQQLWVLSRDDKTRQWNWNQLELPDAAKKAPMQISTALRPAPTTETQEPVSTLKFLDVFTVADNTLSVIRQSPQGDGVLDATKPTFCPPIPLQPDVTLMTSQAGASTGNELLVVDTDGILQTLLKDPVSGHWADAVLQLPSSELEQVSAYRVELMLQDSWNTGVGNQPLRVTASTPVAAMLNGQAVNLGSVAATVPTDTQGQAVIALVADGLSAPTLTIAGDGIPDANVNPSGPINTYMQGGTPLNYQPPLTGDTLKNAQTSDGQTIAPGLSDADAKGGVANMSTAANWAASPSLAAARRSATLARRDGRLGGRNAKGQIVTAEELASDIDNWLHDALHAIKKAAVAVTKITVDAATKTFTVTADFARWAGQAVTIPIHGIEDAAHVIHAVLNKIGAAIVKAVKWLEAEVLGLLRATAAVASQYETWIGDALTQVGAQLRQDGTAVDSWLAAQQKDITTKFAAFAHSYPASASLSTMATSSSLTGHSPRSGRSPGSQGGRAGDAANPSTDTPHSSWLFNKVKNELTGDLAVTPIGDAETLLAGFGQAAGQALGDFTTAFEDLLSFFKTVISHPEDVKTVGVQKLLTVLTELTDGVFTFVRGVVTTTMKLFAELADIIPTMLATPLEEALGVVGKLLGLIGLGNVTIGKLVAMLFAFPTVLAYKIVHGSTAVPFGLSVAGQRQRGELGDASADLQFCAGAALGVWAVFDTVSASFTADKVPSPMIFTAVDIAAPVIVSVLTVPATRGGEPFHSPPVGPDDDSKANFASWILGLLPAFNVATALYIDKKSALPQTEKDEWAENLLWLTSGCGIGSLVTGVVGNSLNPQPNGADYAGAVLNNMANIITPGLGQMAKDTEGVSALIAFALTAVCGVIGAVVYGFDG